MATVEIATIGQGPGEAGPAGGVEAAEQVREDLAELGAGQVHGHREPRRQQRPDRVPGEEQARQRGKAGRARQLVDRVDREQRPDERECLEQPELEDRDPDRDEHRDRGAEGGPGRGPEDVRVRQRVAQQALERDSGHGQRQPDEHRREDTRQAQVHDDRLRGGAVLAPEVDAEEALREDRDRVGRLDRHGPEADAEDQRNRQGREPTSRQQ